MEGVTKLNDREESGVRSLRKEQTNFHVHGNEMRKLVGGQFGGVGWLRPGKKTEEREKEVSGP